MSRPKQKNVNIYDQFKMLLDNGPREEEVHQFLYKHPFMLADLGYGVRQIFSKPSFGSDFKADFALAGWGNYTTWTFVEIERPDHRLFTKEGLIAQPLNRAIAQVNSWWIWLYDYGECASKEFHELGGDYTAAIVIGRRHTLSPTDVRRLEQLNATQLGGKLRIVTYDVILDEARDGYLLPERNYTEFRTIKQWARYMKSPK